MPLLHKAYRLLLLLGTLVVVVVVGLRESFIIIIIIVIIIIIINRLPQSAPPACQLATTTLETLNHSVKPFRGIRRRCRRAVTRTTDFFHSFSLALWSVLSSLSQITRRRRRRPVEFFFLHSTHL